MDGIQIFDYEPKRTLVQKVLDAIDDYRQRHKGSEPDTCLIAPELADGQDLDAVSEETGVIVRPARYVLKKHLWIGMEEIPVGLELDA